MSPRLDTFQLDTIEFLDHADGRAVVADPMGARKTGTVLTWLDEQPKVQRTLVVAPGSVHGHWAREAARFAPTTSVHHGQGTKAQRAKALALACGPFEGYPSLYTTTYESMKADQYHLARAHFDCVVFDEGHKLKGRRTQVALCANEISKAEHCIIVTGTPVLNHAAELWQYLHMLAPRVYTSFWRWVETHYIIEESYFNGVHSRPVKVIHGFRDGHEDLVRHQIEPFFIQRDIVDLFPSAPWVAEPEHIEISVELSAGERKVYDNLVKHKWTLVSWKELTTKNSLDLTTRLTQITSDWGGLGGDEDGTKVKAAVDLCDNLLEREEPVLIFAKYRATVRRIVNALLTHDVGCCSYTGDEPQAQRDGVITQFQKGECQVLVGTLDSLSEGVDGLQERCSNIIMVDRHWTPAKNDQAIGRLRRSGQIKRVTVYHIFAERTIDETITAACLRKTNVIELLRGASLTDALYGRV